MSRDELVALVCCDLGSIVRGRTVPHSRLTAQLEEGVGWVPANQALTPIGTLAEPNPFGSTGDLRLMPDRSAQARVIGSPGVLAYPLQMFLCDIVHPDGSPGGCCPRHFLRESLAELQAQLGARVMVSFEHEFQLLRGTPPPPPPAFSLEAVRRSEPFATEVMQALGEAGLEPERFFAEYADHQFEIPLAPAEGMTAADRAILFREIVRELARASGARASFTPLLDPDQAGNGVHIHLSLLGEDGEALLHDPARPACVSELGGRFAAGILRHAGALSALSAPSPVSGARLAPHQWSAGALCLGERNREALLRIPAPAAPGRESGSGQIHLEYRGADAAGNPYLALGAIIRAGVAGVREGLEPAAILDRDPAELDALEAERFGVGALPRTLEAALEALARDRLVRSWLGAELYEAYTSVKRAEVQAAQGEELAESCRRYGAIY